MGDKCKFWVPQKRSGCRFGDRCRYAHPVPSSSKCRFLSKGGCRDGDQCLFSHDGGGGGDDADEAGGGKGRGGRGGGRHDHHGKGKDHHGHSKGRGKDHGKGGSRVGSAADKMVEVFRRFDTNDDGVIERGELKAVLQAVRASDELSDAQIDILLQAVDTNGDGMIQYEEFVVWLNSSEDEWDSLRCEVTAADDGDPIKLVVSDLAGPVYEIEANTAWSVKRLKVAIAAVSGIPATVQDLAGGGDDLEDAETLRSRKLSGMCDFQLMDRRLMSGAGGMLVAEAVAVAPASAVVVAPVGGAADGGADAPAGDAGDPAEILGGGAAEGTLEGASDKPPPAAAAAAAAGKPAEKPAAEIEFEMDLF